MAKRVQYTATQIIAALQEGKGYVSKAASILGCTPMTVYNYRDRFLTVAEAWQSIRESRHDFVENALHKQIDEGNVTAIIFYLKTQAQQRGYIEKIQVDTFVRRELDSLLDKLEHGLDADTYQRVLAIIAGIS